MSIAETSAYFLGDHQAEFARLEFQASAWKDITVQLCDEAGIRAGHRVVDLGCGPGFFSFELASIVGRSGEVLAVDKSEEFLSVLRKRVDNEHVSNVSVLQHDIESAPLPHDGFDFVLARWLDPYVNDLDDLVAKELRCLKPGGRTINLGTFNYRGTCIGPWSDEFDFITTQIIELYRRNGRQISAGNLVPAALCAHGASIVSIRNVSPLARPSEDLWEWYRQFSFSMLPRLVDAGLISPTAVQAYISTWEARSRTPGAFVSVPSHIGIIGEKRAPIGQR